MLTVRCSISLTLFYAFFQLQQIPEGSQQQSNVPQTPTKSKREKLNRQNEANTTTCENLCFDADSLLEEALGLEETGDLKVQCA